MGGPVPHPRDEAGRRRTSSRTSDASHATTYPAEGGETLSSDTLLPLVLKSNFESVFFGSGFDVLFKKKLNFLYYRSCMSSSRVSFAAKRTYAAPPHIIDDTEDDMPTPPARQQPPPIFDLNTMEWIFNNISLCSKCL
jgi:hypothetical protein